MVSWTPSVSLDKYSLRTDATPSFKALGPMLFPRRPVGMMSSAAAGVDVQLLNVQPPYAGVRRDVAGSRRSCSSSSKGADRLGAARSRGGGAGGGKGVSLVWCVCQGSIKESLSARERAGSGQVWSGVEVSINSFVPRAGPLTPGQSIDGSDCSGTGERGDLSDASDDVPRSSAKGQGPRAMGDGSMRKGRST